MADETGPEMLNIRRSCFFEIFSSNLSSTRLKIPVAFVKYLEGRTCGSVSLMGPSGNIWLVDLVRREEDLFLEDGWPTFVSDHLIECGELLVFRYDGEFCFTVQVFGLNACEKEAALHSNCSQDYRKFSPSVGQKRERVDEAACLDKSLECVLKKVREVPSEFNSESQNLKAIVLKSCQEDSFCDEQESIPCLRLKSSVASKSKASNEKTEASLQQKFGKDYSSLHERGSGSIFSEREKRVAQSFISCFPYFVRIMKRFNVGGSYTLNIPYQFSMAHLPNCKTEIVLRTIKGGCWTVNSVPTTRVNTSHTFCGGWIAFVRQNDIKMGDVCIFELIRKLELRVFILRVGKEIGDNQSGKIVPNGVDTGAGCAAAPQNVEIFRKKSRKNRLKVLSKLLEISEKKGSKKKQVVAFSSDMRRYGNEEHGKDSGILFLGFPLVNETPVQSGKNIGSKLDSLTGAMVILDEKKAAKCFTSAYPNFVRIMRKFNISGSYTLKIPHQFSTAHLPNCKTEIVLCNLKGECWSVNSVPDSKGRAVHTFCGGWMAFVRDNNVKMGDVCMFELISEREMRVHISGAGHEVHEHQCGKASSHDLHPVTLSSNNPPP